MEKATTTSSPNCSIEQDISQRITELGDPSTLTRVKAFEQLSQIMRFFKTNPTYSNTNAAALYKQKWQEHTRLNPVSDWFLLQMRLHATKLFIGSAVLLSGVYLTSGFLLVTASLTLPLTVLVSISAIVTVIGALAADMCIKEGIHGSLEQVEENAKIMPCISN